MSGKLQHAENNKLRISLAVVSLMLITGLCTTVQAQTQPWNHPLFDLVSRNASLPSIQNAARLLNEKQYDHAAHILVPKHRARSQNSLPSRLSTPGGDDASYWPLFQIASRFTRQPNAFLWAVNGRIAEIPKPKDPLVLQFTRDLSKVKHPRGSLNIDAVYAVVQQYTDRLFPR